MPLIEKEEHKIYNNYRCMKCGNIISRASYYRDKLFGLMVPDIKYHNCPEGIEMDKGEVVRILNIGYSNEPLTGAEVFEIEEENPPAE